MAIESSIWVAMITGAPRRRAARTMVFWATGTSSGATIHRPDRRARAISPSLASSDRLEVAQRGWLFNLCQG